MALSMQEKQHVGKEVALRYLRVRKKEKGIMLREEKAKGGIGGMLPEQNQGVC